MGMGIGDEDGDGDGDGDWDGDGDGDGDGDDSIVAHLSVCLCVPDLCVRGLLSIVNVWWSALFFLVRCIDFDECVSCACAGSMFASRWLFFLWVVVNCQCLVVGMSLRHFQHCN